MINGPWKLNCTYDPDHGPWAMGHGMCMCMCMCHGMCMCMCVCVIDGPWYVCVYGVCAGVFDRVVCVIVLCVCV